MNRIRFIIVSVLIGFLFNSFVYGQNNSGNSIIIDYSNSAVNTRASIEGNNVKVTTWGYDANGNRIEFGSETNITIPLPKIDVNKVVPPTPPTTPTAPSAQPPNPETKRAALTPVEPHQQQRPDLKTHEGIWNSDPSKAAEKLEQELNNRPLPEPEKKSVADGSDEGWGGDATMAPKPEVPQGNPHASNKEIRDAFEKALRDNNNPTDAKNQLISDLQRQGIDPMQYLDMFDKKINEHYNKEQTSKMDAERQRNIQKEFEKQLEKQKPTTDDEEAFKREFKKELARQGIIKHPNDLTDEELAMINRSWNEYKKNGTYRDGQIYYNYGGGYGGGSYRNTTSIKTHGQVTQSNRGRYDRYGNSGNNNSSNWFKELNDTVKIIIAVAIVVTVKIIVDITVLTSPKHVYKLDDIYLPKPLTKEGVPTLTEFLSNQKMESIKYIQNKKTNEDIPSLAELFGRTKVNVENINSKTKSSSDENQNKVK